jgi:signal transduction histidine kinase
MPDSEQFGELINPLELASVVAHEVNNLLNSIVLHTALMERSLSPESQAAVQPELAVIRQAVTRAGRMLQRWQNDGRQASVALTPVDLNHALQDLPLPQGVYNPAGDVILVNACLEPDLPAIMASREDVIRLVRLLLECAAHSSPRGSSITVSSHAAPGQVFLSVQDQGPAIESDLLERAFEPFAPIRGDLVSGPQDEVRLAACKVLARRQKAAIAAVNDPQGGVTITVTFPLTCAG